ncbi:nuclear transport factor 2 family protein [Natronoglycomyces albus]|uniref:Nuclear transport factor 2 family protein n=1 Tax=Natronoglycomyces albus TaxID=2811108 RepID=A0A895XKN2_9ACTN|nr:nuclear transport factor 2 family protein [Natronoglycomyces albus]QSB05617.1 nuclear transport factor 2 family protein [Natronoglycomyces albus]
MTSRNPAQLADRQLDAYNRRELEAFIDCYAEDVRVFAFPSGEELTDRSGDAFRKRYGDLFAANPNLHAELINRVVHGDVVIDHEHVTGLADGSEKYAVAMYEVGQDFIEKVWFVSEAQK